MIQDYAVQTRPAQLTPFSSAPTAGARDIEIHILGFRAHLRLTRVMRRRHRYGQRPMRDGEMR